MDTDFWSFVKALWHDKPSMIILFVGGVIIFLLLVIDTYRHRKQRKERHRIKH